MIDPHIQQAIQDAIILHIHDGNGSQQIDAFNIFNLNRYYLYRIVAPTTDTTVANVVGGDFVMPFAGFLTDIGATVDTAGTTNTTDIDVNKNGSTIFSTKITIDSTEKTSRTAAARYVFLNQNAIQFQTGDILTFDVDAVSTTAAKGLTIFINAVASGN